MKGAYLGGENKAGGTHHPCFTANTARILCRFGLVEDERVQTSLAHLLEEQHTDGGWRCKKVALGESPETDASNPGVTLFALDAFRLLMLLHSLQFPGWFLRFLFHVPSSNSTNRLLLA